MKTKQLTVLLGIIILLAGLLRISAIFFVWDSHVPWKFEPEEIADLLVESGQYQFDFYHLTPVTPTSFVPPVYPMLLAFTRIVGSTIHTSLLQIIQIILSCLVIIFLYGLVIDVSGNHKQALFAALIAAVYPPFISYSVDISTTTVETFFVILGIWLAVRTVKNYTLINAILCGVSLAMAALTRSTWLPILPLIPLWWLGNLWKKWGLWLKLSCAMGLAAVIVFFPWIYYNYRTHGVLIVTSTNGGLNFWIGNNAKSNGEYIFPTQIDRALVESTLEMSEVERDRFFYQQGWQFILEHPQQFIKLAFRKLLYFLFFRPNIGSSLEAAEYQLFDLVKLGFIVSWLALLPFAVLGLISLRGKWCEHILFILIFVIQALTTMVYFSGTRFRTPIDGLVIVWAVFGLSVILPFLKSYKNPVLEK